MGESAFSQTENDAGKCQDSRRLLVNLTERRTDRQTDIYAASFVDISLKVSTEHWQQSNQKQTMGKNVRKHNQR